jgi:hypothetical protein
MTYKNRSQNRAHVFVFKLAAAMAAVLVPGCNPFTHDSGPSDSGASSGSGGHTGSGGASVSTGGHTGTGGGSGSGGASGQAGQGGGTGGRGGAAGNGAGGNGAGGIGGSAAGGATGTPSCTNDRRDGTETGIDCGGSCPACPNYKINAPGRSDTLGSSCNNGPGYMCARQMVFSPEFKQAAFDDWGMDDPPFVYGVVGHDLDAGGVDANGRNACCQCYQLIFESPTGASGLPTPKPMIVQAFNTAAGGPHNFDIYMAAGGFGANNGCAAGSNPMYSMYPDLGGNFTGGVRASRYGQCANNNQWNSSSIGSQTCQDYVASQCTQIQSTFSATNQSTSQASCEQSNYVDSHYHINWSVRAMRVECPTNLTRVTGCKLSSQNLPQANPAAKDVGSATSGFRSGYTTTTMQDCCRPTCAYPSNVSGADSQYSVFYTCDRSGNAQ